MDRKEVISRGGVYLLKLNPVKSAEVGKIRPGVVLTSQTILEVAPPTIFICPLSSQSYPEFRSLHVELPPRDNLQVKSYALVEHSRAISMERFIYPRIAQLTTTEINEILHRLQRMLQ